MNTQEDDSLLYRSGGGKNKLWVWIGIGLFVAWNILLFILAVVAIAKVNNQSSSSGSSYTYAPISRSFTVGLNQQIGGGTGVSVQPNGRLRVGGGTSVYLQRGPRPQIPQGATNIQTTTFNPPITSAVQLTTSELVFMAWTHNGKAYGSVGSLSVSGTSLNTWSPAQEIPGLALTDALIPLYAVTTSAHKKSFAIAGGGKLVIGTITKEESPFGFATSTPQSYNGTTNTLLARLSGTEFALSYNLLVKLPEVTYKMEVVVVNVTYTATGDFQSLTMSNAFPYTADRPYHTIFPLVDWSKPLTNEFVLAYPSSSAILINSTTAPNDTLVVLKGIWNAQTQVLSFGPSTSLVHVHPTGLMTGVAMPTNTDNQQAKGVIFFIDEHTNNAVTAVTVTKSTATLAKIDSLSFGSTLIIGDDALGENFQVSGNTIVPFLSACAVDDQKLGLAYSNYADNGKINTMVLELNPYTLTLSLISAKFALTDVNPQIYTYNYWVQAAPLRFNSQVGFAVWSYLQTNSDADVTTQSVVEIAPPPLGMTPTNIKGPVQAGNPVSVVLSGVYTLSAGAFTGNEGRYYYTDTLGMLHVRNVSLASIDYVISDQGVLLSLNSRVGLAISNNELLLISEQDA